MKFTKEQKIKILSKNEFTPMIGYCFSNPTDQDYQNHFVSKEDIEKAQKEGYKTYFWKEDYDYIMDFDEAWENFIEYYWDDMYEIVGDNERQLLESLCQFLEESDLTPEQKGGDGVNSSNQ
jgi:hypothetical protein